MNVSFKTLATAFAVCALSLSVASCDKKGNEPTPNPKPNPEKPDAPDTPDVPVVAGQELKGDVTADKPLTIKANSVNTLDGTLSVKKGGKLTIEAGAQIIANPKFDSYIIVEQGGQIFVNGTAEAPVIMTSSVKETGAWGGLIICGYAQVNEGSTHDVEVDPGLKYGVEPGGEGFNNADNSGSIKYLILEYTGANNNDEVEHNGLTLNGVGSGTTIENVFVYKSADDAIEFFGGAANVSNLLAVDNDDDMFDFTQGYIGTLKNAYGIWNADHKSIEEDPRGVEADGNHDGDFPGAATQSNFKIENLTIALFNKGSQEHVDYPDDVIKVRRGASATITNLLIAGDGNCKDVFDSTDKKGDSADNGVVISYNNTLKGSNILGKEKNGFGFKTTRNEDLKGTDQAIFAWTGYDFKANTYTSKAK